MLRTIVLASWFVACGPTGSDSAGSRGTRAAGPSTHQAVENPIASVGSAPIGEKSLLHAASRAAPADGKLHTPEEVDKLVDELVVEEMLVQKALENGLHNDPKIRKILVNLLLRKDVFATVNNSDFGEEELSAYYNEHRSDFVVPEKVQARRILIPFGEDRASAEKKAASIHTKLKANPALFADLASKESEGPYKRRGGDLGFMSREGKPGVEPEVVEKVFSMQKEELSAPFVVGDAFQIVRVANRRAATERSFQQMKGSVLRMVRQKRFETLRKDYIDGLRKSFEVKIDTEAIKNVDMSRRPSVKRDPPVTGGHGHNH